MFKKVNMKVLFSSICLMISITSCSFHKDVSKSNTLSDNQSNSVNSEETVIHFAAASNTSYINEAIKKFNEADDGYRIEVVEYDHTLDDSHRIDGTADALDLTDFDLIQKIINTTDIDLVVNWAFEEEANYRILQQKGAFADMYKFMENDDEINTDTLNSHVLKLNEINGELRSIPTFYVAYTLGGNPDYVGTKTNWTIDDLISHWEKMPNNATINRARTKENVYYNLLRPNLELFVDYASGTVNFDSDDFRKILEFCNSFDYGNREKADYDYNAPDFCDSCNISSFSGQLTVGLSDINPETTFVGFPTPNGSGAYLRSFNDSFSICTSSDENKQKGAWEFIRTFFTEEWQEEHALSYDNRSKGYASQNAFCMNNQAQEIIKNNMVNKKYSPPTFESKGETITVQFPTFEDCNALENYLNSIDRWEVNMDDAVSEFILEEIFAYFAGEISIDECIDRIQNRASIWISEKS